MVARYWIPPLTLVVILYLAREVLAPFVIAAALAYVFSPLVTEISERLRLRRLLVLAVLYVVALSIIGAGIYLLGERLVREIRLLGLAGPDIVDVAVVRLLGSDALYIMGQRIDPHTVADWINLRFASAVTAPSDAIHFVEQAFDTVLKTCFVLIALFYFLLDGHKLGPYIARFIPPGHRDRVRDIGRHVHLALGRYVRGQLFLIVFMSTLTYIVLTWVFHLHYALPLAIMTGVLEVIPIVGPIVAASIAGTVGLVQGGTHTMIWVFVAYTVLRQMEDQLVIPIVLGRAVHLHPLITIFAVLTGAESFGVLGALLAIPAAAAVRIIIDDIISDPNAAPEVAPTDAPARPPEVSRRKSVPQTLD